MRPLQFERDAGFPAQAAADAQYHDPVAIGDDLVHHVFLNLGMLDDFGDPRVRLAMVNASYAGPDLPSEVYRGDDIDRQLDAAVRRFVNDNRKNRFSATLRRATFISTWAPPAET